MQGSASAGTAAAGRASPAVAATLLDQSKLELLAMPRDAKEAGLLARLVLVVPSREIATIRKRLSKVVQGSGRSSGTSRLAATPALRIACGGR